MMQDLELGIPTQQTELDLPEADDIKINDRGPVMRAAGNHLELASMNFSFPPSGRGGPVFNFRSENRRFDQSNRCIIPANASTSLCGHLLIMRFGRFDDARCPGTRGGWRSL